MTPNDEVYLPMVIRFRGSTSSGLGLTYEHSRAFDFSNGYHIDFSDSVCII